MKKIFLIAAILISACSYKADAQVSVNINIGRQPLWGPVGYDYVNYYYMPDLDVYYDVPRGLFVYYDFGQWNFAASLPARYGHYDLYRSYKVVINQRDPWLRNSYYRGQYRSYRGRYQPLIRDSRDNRYYTARGRYDRRGYNNDMHANREMRENNDWHDNRQGNHWKGERDHRQHGRGRH
jgi:hypothetical protein